MVNLFFKKYYSINRKLFVFCILGGPNGQPLLQKLFLATAFRISMKCLVMLLLMSIKIIKKNVDFSLNNKHKIPSLSSSVTNPRQQIFINA